MSLKIGVPVDRDQARIEIHRTDVVGFDEGDHALAVAARDGDELCVIGGGEVYALALPLATHMRLTLVDTVVEGADAFFPRFDAGTWREISREPHAADAAHAFAFEFVDYARIG